MLKFLKSGIIFHFLILSIYGQSQSVILNFENGNRAIDQANCWGFKGITYTNNSAEVLSNSWTAKSNFSNSLVIKSPLIKLVNGNISFKTKFQFKNNTDVVANNYSVCIKFTPYNLNEMQNNISDSVISKIALPYNNIQNISIKIPETVANSNSLYKVTVKYIGELEKVNILIDDLIIPGTYQSNPSENCQPLSISN